MVNHNAANPPYIRTWGEGGQKIHCPYTSIFNLFIFRISHTQWWAMSKKTNSDWQMNSLGLIMGQILSRTLKIPIILRSQIFPVIPIFSVDSYFFYFFFYFSVIPIFAINPFFPITPIFLIIPIFPMKIPIFVIFQMITVVQIGQW